MKIGGVLAQWLAIQLIIDVKVLPIRNIILIFYFDARPFLERHREVAVHRSIAAKPILFFGLDGRREWQRRKITGKAVPDAEEIPKGNQYAWLFLVIPIHF